MSEAKGLGKPCSGAPGWCCKHGQRLGHVPTQRRSATAASVAMLGHVEYGSAAMCRWLDLERPGLAAVRRTMGWSPLHLAAMEGQCALIERLVAQHGCALTARSANSWTPLHYAAAHNQVRPPAAAPCSCRPRAVLMLVQRTGVRCCVSCCVVFSR